MPARLTSLSVVLVAVFASPARGDACLTNDLDTACEIWSAFVDSPWAADGFGREAAFAMAVTARGPVVTGMTALGSDTSRADYLTAGLDHDGSVVWTHRYDNGYSDRALAIGASPDGDAVYVTGESTQLGSSFGIATIAYEATGGPRWVARVDRSGIERGTAVAVAPDGDTVYVGAETGAVDTRLTLLAYDAATGDLLWEDAHQGKNVGSVTGVSVSSDGSRVFLTGYTGGADARYATAAFAVEETGGVQTGSLLWADEYDPGASSDRAAGIAVAPDGETVYVTGTKLSGGARAVTIAYDSEDGRRVWLSSEGPAGGSGWGNGVAVAPDGQTVYVVGDQAAPAQDAMVMSLDSGSGTRRWLAGYGSIPFVERARAVVVAPGGDIFVTIQSTVNAQPLPSDVTTISYSAAGVQRWIARFNPSTREISGTSGADMGHPVGLGLSQDGARLYVGGTFDYAADPTHAATANIDFGALAYLA